MNYLSKSTNILLNLGIESLNEMQLSANETILNKKETLLLSPTGSGKTLAFLYPLYQLIDPDAKGIQALILVPSRELGMQIEQVWKKMGTTYKVNICYGGHNIETELKNLSNAPAVLIGTPGRIMDHIERESIDLSTIQTLVLDEFDKSLQLGFHEQMSFIISRLKNVDKRILASATNNIEIPKYTGISKPKILDFIPKNEKSVSLLDIKKVISTDKDKLISLFHLICNLNSESGIVFCNHRDAVERISDYLNGKGITSTFYHGGMDQDERERGLIQFRNGSVPYTDLAARGLDIPDIKHVIHYHLPFKEEEFTHRNGRTARMKSEGTAYLIIHKDEKKLDYVDYNMEEFVVNLNTPIPNQPNFVTLYISGGKKNKLNKIDIVGFFSQKGNLEKADLGLIEVKDFISFAAVKRSKIQQLLKDIQDQKMKGKKYKIAIARPVQSKED